MGRKLYRLTLYWAGEVRLTGLVVGADIKRPREVTMDIKDRSVPVMRKTIGATPGEATIVFDSFQDMAMFKEALALTLGINFTAVLEEQDSSIRHTLKACAIVSESGLSQIWKFVREI